MNPKQNTNESEVMPENQQPSEGHSVEPAAAKPRSRMPLIIMLVVSIFPMAGAYIVFFTGVGMPDQTVNAGVFLQPAKSLENLLQPSDWQSVQENKKWRMLLPISADCTEPCQQNLYTSRQVHIRLDQRSDRVERMAVVDANFPETALAKLKEEHPRLKVLSVDEEQKIQWFSELVLPESTEQDYYLLVDQEGRAMMVYDNRHHGNDVLKDLKRAIKFSIDYQ